MIDDLPKDDMSSINSASYLDARNIDNNIQVFNNI